MRLNNILVFTLLSVMLSISDASLCTAEVTKEESARLIGEEASEKILNQFLNSLQQAVQTRGFAQAVSFCHEEVATMGEDITALLPTGVTFTRVGNRVRNPANTPDSTDLQTLEFFESITPNQIKGERHLVRIESPSFQGYRFYRPIITGNLCLGCHGNTSNIAEDVKEIIKQSYPEDNAANYSEGDLRGVLRVMITDGALIPK